MAGHFASVYTLRECLNSVFVSGICVHLVALKAPGQTGANAQGKISVFLIAVKREVPPVAARSSAEEQPSSLLAVPRGGRGTESPIPSPSGWGPLGSCHTVHVTTDDRDGDGRRKQERGDGLFLFERRMPSLARKRWPTPAPHHSPVGQESHPQRGTRASTPWEAMATFQSP